MESLYTAASLDRATGNLILTVVNLQPEAMLTLGGYRPSTVEVKEMASFDRSDANTLDEPFRVAPSVRKCLIAAETPWRFPPESLTILRFRRS